jgi:hypothetical protein
MRKGGKHIEVQEAGCAAQATLYIRSWQHPVLSDKATGQARRI